MFTLNNKITGVQIDFKKMKLDIISLLSYNIYVVLIKYLVD